MNKSKTISAIIGAVLFLVGYYLSGFSYSVPSIRQTIQYALGGTIISQLIIPLQALIPALLLLGGLGVILQLFIRSRRIVLGVLVACGIMLVTFPLQLPIGYIMFKSTRYIFIPVLAFFLWVILRMNEGVLKKSEGIS